MKIQSTHIQSLYDAHNTALDELTTWYQAMTYRYPGSHLSRKIFAPEESETELCWHVTIALPAGKELTRPVPDEFIYKFRHLDLGAEIEYDENPATLTNWKENLLDWAKR